MRDEGIQIPLKRAIIGPLAFRWRSDEGPTLNAGFVAL